METEKTILAAVLEDWCGFPSIWRHIKTGVLYKAYYEPEDSIKIGDEWLQGVVYYQKCTCAIRHLGIEFSYVKAKYVSSALDFSQKFVPVYLSMDEIDKELLG